MGERRVYRHKTVVESETVAIQCNACGKERTLGEHGKYAFGEDMHDIPLSGGWGDTFPADLQTIRFTVCGGCLRAWTDTFKVPVESTWSVGAAEPFDVIHSEEGASWVVECGWARPAGTDYSEPLEEWSVDGEIPALGVWRHFKGRHYEVLTHVRSALPPYEPLVVYRALYDDSKTFVRPMRMWGETVPDPESPGRTVARFSFVP